MMNIEYESPEKIKAFQEEKLREQVHYLMENSAYYRRMFNENGIDPSSVMTLEDLRHVPFTEKKDLQLYNEDFLCVPKEDIADYMTTSGTLGDPVVFAATSRDLDRLAYNEKISFECADGHPGEIYQLMTTLDKRFMAGYAYVLGIRSMGASIIRVGNGIPELQWDTINRIHPDAIICVPSFILKIIKYAEDHGIDYRGCSVRKAVCIGENLREQDFSLNLLGKRINEKWPELKLYSTYASTEMGTSFCECGYGCGGHHHPELIICELIDDQGAPVAEGEEGELVITTLGVEAMPLLRFRTGDMARFHYGRCACGRTTMRISPIIGRKNHMIKFKGTTLYPPAINDVCDNTPYLENYVVILSDNEIGADDVTVRIGLKYVPLGSDGLPLDVIKDMKDRFRARIRVAPDIRIVPVNENNAIIFPDRNRKAVKLIDNRKLSIRPL
ncbi:MAG: AMP-binding protein [Bacteroidetes bacterium]|uniref:AMP-binding protein n=1 Tax=Candidatus Merdivivens pullistercoris TaxID=2840873 RepID=A0A9D9I439_9BACT|nr:AMP-binding protein [Candidatus Merdivivens pullistercoris]